MKNFSPYTDLALEVAESLTNNADNDLEGLKIFTEDCEMEKEEDAVRACVVFERFLGL